MTGGARLALAAALALSAARSSPRAAPEPGPRIPFVQYKLDNGLEVILAEDHRLPLVAVNLWYRASPANEPKARSGFAHLFEHMMYEGSKHVAPGQHIKLLEQNGVTLYNATTDFDRTSYFETLPADRLELALWLESDRMGFLADSITQARLDNQREVVRNERRQDFDNKPYGPSELAMIEALYPKDHPYHGDVIGAHEDLAAATVDDVRDFHRRFYSPQNATLAIAGDLKPDDARALIAKYFGELPGGTRQPPRLTPVPAPAARRIVVEESVTLPRVSAGWVTAPAFTPGAAELELAARLLGHGKSSRLYRRLVHERQIASDVGCERQALSLGSPFLCFAVGRADRLQPAAREELAKALDAEVASLRSRPPAPEELERAKNGRETEALQQLEQLGGFGGKSDVLQFYHHHLGDPGSLARDLARYRAITPAQIRAAVEKWLDQAHRISIVTVPRKGDPAGAAK